MFKASKSFIDIDQSKLASELTAAAEHFESKYKWCRNVDGTISCCAHSAYTEMQKIVGMRDRETRLKAARPSEYERGWVDGLLDCEKWSSDKVQRK